MKYYKPASGTSSENASDITTDPKRNIYVTDVTSKGYSANNMVTVKYNSAGVFQ